jgi:hypothetical protein
MSEFTLEDYKIFMEKNTKADCPCCGSNEWSTIGAGEEALNLIVSHGDSISLSETLPLIALICRKCFYARLHIKSLIEEKLSISREGKNG